MKKRELKEMGVSVRQKLRDAIQRGAKEEALSKLDEMIVGETKLRNALTDWLDMLLTHMTEKLGEESVPESMRVNWERNLKPFMGDQAGEPDAEKRLRGLAYILTGVHGIDIEVEEDQEKFIIKSPCDTGGRIGAKKEFGKTSRAYPWSNSRKGFPYYCTHCTICYEMIFTQEYGFPRAVFFPPEKPGQPCLQYFYKDSNQIPQKHYQMFGIAGKGKK